MKKPRGDTRDSSRPTEDPALSGDDAKLQIAELEARAAALESALDGRTREIDLLRRERARTETSMEELLTQVETMAEDLARARDEAIAAARARSTFLATMSHEIRTPMNAILGMANILSESDLTPEQREWTETIRTSGDHLLTVINDILDFTRLASGKLRLERLPFRPAAVIDEAFEIIAPLAHKKGLALARIVDHAAAITLISDPGRIRQVLVNYLSNAVKFTDKGTIFVSLGCQPAGDGRFQLHYAVQDPGIGIPQSKLDRLFQSFSQVDDSTQRRYGGTGLGLAICKSLAERMGGRVWTDSHPGVGSTFHVTLLANAAPTLPRPAHEPERATPAASSRPATLRILIAEDNAVNLKITLLMLERLGYRAGVAHDGREVLEALRRAPVPPGSTPVPPYDVILMDVQMPVMDGIQATRAIGLEWPKPRRPRIIALTAGVTEEERIACVTAGMDDFLHKPIAKAELIAALERCKPLAVDG